MVISAAGLLGAVAWHHPELRLVDFIAFSGRAQRVVAGLDLLSPRYPVGYPALLGLSTALLGDVLVAGKVLSVVAGVLAVAVAERWLGLITGLWLLVQLPLLQWGSSEGTDMAAVALALAALAVAWPQQPRRASRASSVWVGVFAGGAAMMRYPAAVVLPVALVGVLWQPRDRGARLGLAVVALLLVTAPHWLAAAVGAGPLWPDGSENAAIGAGPGGAGLAARWWPGVRRAADTALGTWPARLGAVGLAVGLLRRDRRAVALVLFALLHLAVLGVFFSNDRLVLPVTLSVSLGVAFLVPRAVLAILVGAVLWWTWPAALVAAPGSAAREEIQQAALGLSGPVASTSPWFVLHRPDGWLDAPVLVKDAVAPGEYPGSLRPEALVAWAQQREIQLVVIDTGRVSRTYPGLRPLLTGDVAGLEERARSSGWRLLAVESP